MANFVLIASFVFTFMLAFIGTFVLIAMDERERDVRSHAADRPQFGNEPRIARERASLKPAHTHRHAA